MWFPGFSLLLSIQKINLKIKALIMKRILFLIICFSLGLYSTAQTKLIVNFTREQVHNIHYNFQQTEIIFFYE